MKKSFLITAALAAFGAASAFAQISYATGDLLVGFSQTGATNNLQIDLGAAFPLTSATTPIDFGNISGALAGLGGTGAISWSSFAQVSTPVTGSVINGVTYLPNALFLTSATAPAALTSPTATGPSSVINTIAVNMAALTPLGTGILSKAAYQAAGGSYSYSTLQSTTFAQQVSGTNGAGSISIYLLNSLTPAVTVGKKTTPQSDELPTLLGTLNLSTTGELTFTAIPEPSTYAALLGVATLGFVAIRRRKQAAQLVA